MPLVRVPVRNEYGLGHPELYRDADREDPKALLEGVAVAGLVGILRQLGDLAEFAAEVFHGLQEQVMSTSSRSHKLMVRVQRIEAVLPPIEKAMLAQKSHIHFAYTTGSVWRARLQIEQNHFIYGDLPHFIMDSYEECSDPPRLHLLDKFDNGGPGSCLKRYSDPTFFKKASALSSEANVSTLSKCRKPHRSKKKRKWQRTVFSRGPSVSSRTDRTQFASLKASGQISASQTVSTFDGTIKSDQEDQSKTFNLRTDSGYIECVFHPACPIKPEEHEPEQSTFSNLEMLRNDTFDLASVDECSNAVDDDFRQSSMQEQIEASSSSVTWDEKTEIVEPTVHQVENVETAEIHRIDFNGDTEEEGAVNNNNVGKIDVSVDNEGILTSISSPIRLDDLESEPENYMDALNTIELESETDVDFQTKREVEQSFNCNNDREKDEIHVHMAHLPDVVPSNQTKQEVEQSCTFKADRTNDGTYEFIVDNSDCQPTDLESCSAVHNASYEESSFDNPISSQFPAHKELPQPNEESSNNSNSLDMEFCFNNILESSNKETDIIKIPSSGPEELNQQAPTSNEVKTPSGEHSSPKEPSGVQSVQFWTNGGLLGLEPSKPPVFSAQNAASQEPKASGTDVAKSSLTLSNIVNNNGDVGKPDELVQSSEVIERNSSNCSTSYRDDGNVVSDKKTTWRFLSTVLDANREKNGYFQLSNSFNNNFGHSFSRIYGIIPKNELKIDADVRAVHTEASQGDFSDASQISKLSNRIPANDFQRSLAHDQKTESPGSRKTANFEQKCKSQGLAYRTLSDRTLKGCYGNESPILSPSSSPPLQHMKISFEPIDGLGTSKLKLKFPAGIFRQESSRDMLPSFQLVPEPATPQHDIVPDSDDDTFCRSSPYMSDDCISNDSESNSEQWDSDDNPRNKDNELYDYIRSISLKESISSSLAIEEIGHEGIEVDYGFQSSYADNCAESCQSNCLPNLPSLSTLNPLFEQEMKSSCDTKNLPESHFLTEHTPLPPPLPPSQWRNMKPQSSNVTITKQESISEALYHGIDVKILGSTIFPQIKPNLVRQQLDNNEAGALSPKGEPEKQRSSGLKEVNQAISGRAIDEKEDFLHQIRTQSFNLRRTMTDKPNVTAPGPTANVKVTAILEKANAIRQAVGSEHGEDDDNWSDT